MAGDRPSVKPGESGQMMKSVTTICGIDAMTLSTEQLHLICASLKLSGYRSKPKAELELEQEQIARQRLVQKLKELGVNPENL